MKKADIITRICVFIGAPMIGLIGGIIAGVTLCYACMQSAITGDIETGSKHV